MKINKFLEANKYENIIHQNLWDIAKAGLRGMLMAINAYMKKLEISLINNSA